MEPTCRTVSFHLPVELIAAGARMSRLDVAETARPFQSLCGRITSHAAVAPDRLALIGSSVRLTYAQLEQESNQLAAHLLDMGAGRSVVSVCCWSVRRGSWSRR